MSMPTGVVTKNFGLAVGKVVEKSKSAFQVERLIKTGKAPKSVIRFDKGKLEHNELPHIHFDEGSALFMNGEWKHGQKKLSNAEIKFLQKNGFKIPSK